MSRPSALTTPAVTVGSGLPSRKPYGLPMATTQSPIWSARLRPMGATGRLVVSIFTTAMSVRSSSPSSRAWKSRPSRSVTMSDSAPAVTCWLVITRPSLLTRNPVPRPSTRCS